MGRIRVISLLLILVTFQTFGGDRSEVWSRMYKRSVSPELKFSVMLNIVELNDRGMIPLLEEILSEDIIANLNNKRSVNQERDFIELTKLVVKELGELKSKGSATLVYNIVKETKDPLLKADGIVALGNMRATNYLNNIAFILKSLNMRPVEGVSSDIENEARVAYGCITALDRFKDIEGYSPVFFASVGWYNQRVRYFADKVLKTIVENPTEALIPIIADGAFLEKEKAIKEIAACRAPAKDKAAASREAMKQGFDNVPESIQETMILTTIRKDAIKILYSNKSDNVEDVYYLSQSVKNGVDLEEKIFAVKTLGVNGTDEAIGALSAILGAYNEKKMNGLDISYTDEDVIRELITTLGDSGNDLASSVLTEVQFTGYPNGIVRVAKAALEKLN